MQLSSANDVKVYNLSAGKTLPEWLEERERRKKAGKAATAGGDAAKGNIQLLQDLEMPVVSTRMESSPDGRFLCAVGTYKPRVRCYEVDQLGLKFERCFDSEVVAFSILSEDYSKMVFLQCDRYVEIHAQFGRYYRLRIPHFGRDLAYHPQSCDAYFVGDRPNVTRLNLEQGRFLSPYETESPSNNVCTVNPEHQLLMVGGSVGAVEAWDPRSRQRAGRLLCVDSLDGEELESGSGVPEVTALSCRDGLNLACGTSSGHVLLFDLRSRRALLTKDHMYGLPVKKIKFHSTYDQVLSLDAKCVKIWDRQTGKPYAAVESEHELNDLVTYPESGLIFMANEQPRMQAHFIPSLGPAPRWCSFLDNLTEEMEESEATEVFDDYKFVTKERLSELELDHLIGSPVLRAYMHGYFMDVRLYRKAESLARPVAGQSSLAEGKIRKKMEEARKKRVELKQTLPEVNRDLFLKLREVENKEKEKKNKGKKEKASLLEDDRFQDLFKDDRFAVDTTEEAYRLLNPVVSKLDESRIKKLEEQYDAVEEDDEDDQDSDGGDSDDSDLYSDGGDDFSEPEEDEKPKKKQKKDDIAKKDKKPSSGVKFYELKKGFSASQGGDSSSKKRTKDKMSLESRLAGESMPEVSSSSAGVVHQMTFSGKKSRRHQEDRRRQQEHIKERAAVRRSTKALVNKKKGLS